MVNVSANRCLECLQQADQIFEECLAFKEIHDGAVNQSKVGVQVASQLLDRFRAPLVQAGLQKLHLIHDGLGVLVLGLNHVGLRLEGRLTGLGSKEGLDIRSAQFGEQAMHAAHLAVRGCVQRVG